MNGNIKKILKWSLSTLILGVIIGAVITNAATPSFITYLMVGSMTETTSYLMFKDGTRYYIKDGLSGEISADSTNASELVNAIVGNDTHIYFKATFHDPIYLTNPIIVPADTYFLTFEGTGGYEEVLRMQAGSDCDMFQVYEDCHQIRWINLGMHGNEAFMAAGDGIKFLGGGTTTDISIQNCALINFRGHAIYTQTTVFASYIIDNYIENSVTGLRAPALLNTEIRGNFFWTNDEGIWIESTTYSSQDNIITENEFHNQVNQAIYIYNSQGNIISGNWFNENRQSIHIRNSTTCIIDSNHIKATTEHGIYLYSVNETVVSNNLILGSGFTLDNTYDGLWIGSGSSGQWASYHNIIEGNLISSYGYLNNMRYGIDELGAGYANNNTYLGNTVRYADTNNILVNGEHSRVYHDWNGSRWITGHDPWISPVAEEYLPLMYRVDRYGLVYGNDSWITIRTYTQANIWTSWLAWGKTYGYGVYSFDMLIVNNITNVYFHFGLERRHGWASEGIIMLYWNGTYWHWWTSHGGVDELTWFMDVDFTVQHTLTYGWNATHVDFFVDGALHTTHAISIPNGYEMQIFAEIGTGGVAPAAEPLALWREGSWRQIG